VRRHPLRLPILLAAGAVVAAGCSSGTSAFAVETGAPAITKATVSSDSLNVVWSTATADLNGYRVWIEQGSDPAAFATDAADTFFDAEATDTTATIDLSGLARGTSYLVDVMALTDDGGIQSDPVVITLAETAPPAPEQPSLLQADGKHVVATVPDYNPQDDASRHVAVRRQLVLYRNGKAVSTVTVAKSGEVSHRFTVQPGHSYRVADRVTTAMGASPFSPKSAVVTIEIPAPAQVKHLHLKNTGSGYRVTWAAAADAGHSRIVRYVVTLTEDDKRRGTRKVSASHRSAAFSGTKGLHSVRVTVVAVNKAGGTSSASSSWFSSSGFGF